MTEIFSIISRIINVLRGGSADMTLCAAAAREDLKIRVWIDWFFEVFTAEENHCDAAWEYHVDRSQQAVVDWMKRNGGAEK